MVLRAFLASLVVVAAAAGYGVVHGIELWRQTKRTGRTMSAELALFEERSARTERLFAEAERSNVALQEALAQLRVSRARFQVLVGSLEAARRRTWWLRAFLP